MTPDERQLLKDYADHNLKLVAENAQLRQERDQARGWNDQAKRLAFEAEAIRQGQIRMDVNTKDALIMAERAAYQEGQRADDLDALCTRYYDRWVSANRRRLLHLAKLKRVQKANKDLSRCVSRLKRRGKEYDAFAAAVSHAQILAKAVAALPPQRSLTREETAEYALISNKLSKPF